jgi:hypothetical protein
MLTVQKKADFQRTSKGTKEAAEKRIFRTWVEMIARLEGINSVFRRILEFKDIIRPP